MRSVCSVTDCGRSVHGHGLCSMHHQRWSKHGNAGLDRPLYAKAKVGPESPEWRGDEIGYGQAHQRVRDARGSAADYSCSCGKPAAEWAYDGLDPEEKIGKSGLTYSTDIRHYSPMCRSCHRKHDGVEPKPEVRALGSKVRWAAK